MSHKTFGEEVEDVPDEFYPGPIGVKTPAVNPTEYTPQHQIDDGPDVISVEQSEDVTEILGGVPEDELGDELDKTASGVADEIGADGDISGSDDERENMEGGYGRS